MIGTYGLVSTYFTKEVKSVLKQFCVIDLLENLIYIYSEGLFIDQWYEIQNLLYYAFEYIGVCKYQICISGSFFKPDGDKEIGSYFLSAI